MAEPFYITTAISYHTPVPPLPPVVVTAASASPWSMQPAPA